MIEQKTLSSYPIGNTKPMTLISGPCVVESRDVLFQCAEVLKKISQQFSIPVIFKASLDKANRTSDDGFRGVGVDKALELLIDVKRTFDLPIITACKPFKSS